MKYFLLLTSIAILSACNYFSSQEETASNEYLLKGKISNATSGAPLYLDKLSFNGNQTLDTAILAEDGSFTLKGTLPEPSLYMLRMDNQHSWVVVLKEGKTDFSTDYNDPANTTASGSDNQVLTSFVAKLTSISNELQAIQGKFVDAQTSGNNDAMFQLQDEYNNIIARYNEVIVNMADTSTSLLSALFAASMLNMDQNAAALSKFSEKIKAELPDNSLAQEFLKLTNANAELAIGKPAPNFTLKSIKGETLSLEQVKGKVVLLDFWASWCKPCRIENPNVVRLYNEYEKKGFTVFSVSLDNNLQKWANAIEQDQLSWPYHGSNLKGWQCPVAQQYKINSIPNTFLIDENGIIIDRNLRGAELENKLKQIFGS